MEKSYTYKHISISEIGPLLIFTMSFYVKEGLRWDSTRTSGGRWLVEKS